MPPYAPAGRSPLGRNFSGVAGRLSAEHEWFVSTPVVLKLKDGVVLDAAEGPQAWRVRE